MPNPVYEHLSSLRKSMCASSLGSEEDYLIMTSEHILSLRPLIFALRDHVLGSNAKKHYFRDSFINIRKVLRSAGMEKENIVVPDDVLLAVLAITKVMTKVPSLIVKEDVDALLHIIEKNIRSLIVLDIAVQILSVCALDHYLVATHRKAFLLALTTYAMRKDHTARSLGTLCDCMTNVVLKDEAIVVCLVYHPDPSWVKIFEKMILLAEENNNGKALHITYTQKLLNFLTVMYCASPETCVLERFFRGVQGAQVYFCSLYTMRFDDPLLRCLSLNLVSLSTFCEPRSVVRACVQMLHEPVKKTVPETDLESPIVDFLRRVALKSGEGLEAALDLGVAPILICLLERTPPTRGRLLADILEILCVLCRKPVDPKKTASEVREVVTFVPFLDPSVHDANVRTASVRLLLQLCEIGRPFRVAMSHPSISSAIMDRIRDPATEIQIITLRILALLLAEVVTLKHLVFQSHRQLLVENALATSPTPLTGVAASALRSLVSGSPPELRQGIWDGLSLTAASWIKAVRCHWNAHALDTVADLMHTAGACVEFYGRVSDTEDVLEEVIHVASEMLLTSRETSDGSGLTPASVSVLCEALYVVSGASRDVIPLGASWRTVGLVFDFVQECLRCDIAAVAFPALRCVMVLSEKDALRERVCKCGILDALLYLKEATTGQSLLQEAISQTLSLYAT